MGREPPDKRFYAELRDLNLEFLSLVADRRAGVAEHRLLGFPPEIAAAVRGLAPAERRFVAGAPCLLAGFAGLPRSDAVGETRAALAGLDPGWFDAARVFATGLLTYLSQVVHRGPLATALCVGAEAPTGLELAGASLREVLGCSGAAVGCLRARFTERPATWGELFCTARSDNERLRELCRLTLVPLALAQGPRAAVGAVARAG